MVRLCKWNNWMNKWLIKLYVGVTIGTWVKRIFIALILFGLWSIGDYYFNVHLPMMRRGMHVN